MKNARFWVYHNDAFVKLTLREGETISFGATRDNGEGFTFTGEQLTFEDGAVTRICISDGTDCDGRHTWSSELVCPLSDLHAFEYTEGAGTIYRTPIWQKRDELNRDYAAEAMNY